MNKICTRCGQIGHQAHACQRPNPAHYDDTTPPALDIKRGCSTCLHIAVLANHEPCATCRQTLGYSRWEPMP